MVAFFAAADKPQETEDEYAFGLADDPERVLIVSTSRGLVTRHSFSLVQDDRTP